MSKIVHARRYALGGALGLLGLGLNQLPVTYAPSVVPPVALGDVAVYGAAALFGTGPGVVAAILCRLALVAAAPTFLWGLGIGVAQAAVASLTYRRHGSLIRGVAVLWLAIALAQGLVGWSRGLDLDVGAPGLVAGGLGGILSAILAEALLRAGFFASGSRWVGDGESLRSHVHGRFVFSAMVPVALLSAVGLLEFRTQGLAAAGASREVATRPGEAALDAFLAAQEKGLERIAYELEGSGGGEGPPHLPWPPDEYRGLTTLHLTDADGVIVDSQPAVSTLGQPFRGSRLGDDDLVRRARDGSGVAWGSVSGLRMRTHSARGAEVGLAMARALKAPGEALVGILVELIDTAPLRSLMESSREAGQRLILVDREGRIVVSLDPDLRAGDPMTGKDGWFAARAHASGFRVLAAGPRGLADPGLRRSLEVLLVLLLTPLLLGFVADRLAAGVASPLRALGKVAQSMGEGLSSREVSMTLCRGSQVEEIRNLAGHFADMREALGYHDGVTGLPNRRLLLDRLSLAIAQAQRRGDGLAVLCLNLDRFRSVNESLGHEKGNELLAAAASRLRDCMRQGDTLARLGADEFALLACDIGSGTDAASLADKLLSEVKQPFRVGAQEVFLTASIGISLFPNDGGDATTLLRHAVTASSDSKEQGGPDTFRLFTPSLNTKLLQRLALEGSIRRAIEREEFVLHYQPLIDLSSGRVSGAEALIRWESSEDGLVPPSRFIPLAESSKMILALGSWTLRTACVQARLWQDRGHEGMSVAVNVSARQFRETDFADEVARTLAETGLRSSCLHIEITEGVAMQNLERSVATLQVLRDLGVRISVDDFGTGYSSLSYLRRLPVDTVKLDRSFVSGLGGNLDDAAIAGAVIAMAHSLKLEVIAEGVETVDQLRFLRAQGCEAIQGFLFSPAVTAHDFVALLAEGRSLRFEGLELSG